MKSVNDISIAEINSGFQKINQMGGGGDGLEDQLLGMIFSMDKDRVEWSLNSRIRLISIFTDVGFHSKGDSQDKGKTDAPLRSWWKPQPQYRYHDPRDVVKVADQSFETRFSESPFR